jgi:hypothetical protein
MYQLYFHKSLTSEKWAKYTKGQQILMIANELNRAKNLYDRNMIPEVKNCYERAFELTDLTSEDLKWRGRLKELRRFREILASIYAEKNGNAELNLKLYDALIKMVPEAYNMLH